jgi:hypothetical protein
VLKKSGSLGFELVAWNGTTSIGKMVFLNNQKSLVKLIVSHVESCRVLLQMIVKYTPEELNIFLPKIIVDKIH